MIFPAGSQEISGRNDENTRVWVQQAAIDEVTKPKRSFLSRRISLSASSNSFSTSQQQFVSDSESLGTESMASMDRRNMTWDWKAGSLLENSRAEEGVLVRLDENGSTIRLSDAALQKGDIVLANNFDTDGNGLVRPPHDLITLTHLNEPAVVESLYHRYCTNQIYTNTGAVLLALNPFQNVCGMYGETIMKMYWDKAERNLKQEQPPHVYQIADESFRSMMRGIEDHLLGDEGKAIGDGLEEKYNQSILVSGESGSGKTVTTKFVMKYLAALSQRSATLQGPQKRAYLKVEEMKQPSQQQVISTATKTSSSKTRDFVQPSWSVGSRSSSFNSKTNGQKSAGNSSSANDLASMTLLPGQPTNSIEAQVLHSNPILESFGNARTVRNDNSSRFGKFIEIQFTTTGKLVGAKIDTYLLEKVRLVSQCQGERNYHVFYELLSGAMDIRELAQYYIAKTATLADFRITATATHDRRDGVSDKETYFQLRTAMKTMKFSKGETKQVFSITAALMHASNLTFLELPGEESKLDSKNVHLQAVCLLLGVSSEDLNQALCYFSIQCGQEEMVQRALNREKAETGLEALIKATYGALFDFLVNRINALMSYKKKNAEDNDDETEVLLDKESPVASIGVLDIFGFESFIKNSFEQLCINYCNEALQQQFNAFVLRNEQRIYEREGIEWSFIEFPENQDVLDLIEKRGVGILSILDDQCRAPGTSDKAFCLNVYKTCGSQARFSADRNQTGDLKFSIRHYAGLVEYVAEGFTEKNRDELPMESTELLRNSENAFVRELAAIIEKSHEVPTIAENPSAGAPRNIQKKFHRSNSSVGRATVAGQFRIQLRILRSKIGCTTPHYIRCLKPNDFLVPDQFDSAVVSEQLRCGGILEAVRVARAGFTQHYSHADFVRRYSALAWRELSKNDSYSAQINVGITDNRRTSYPTYVGSSTNSSYGRRMSTNVPNTRHCDGKKPNAKVIEVKTEEEIKAQCKKLVRVLHRKMSRYEKDEDAESCKHILPSTQTHSGRSSPTPPNSGRFSPAPTNSGRFSPATPNSGRFSPGPSSSASIASTTPAAPRSVSKWGNAISTLPPIRTKSSYNSWGKKVERSTKESANSSWRKGGMLSTPESRIQMGKTKVFLRHEAFETIERLRSVELRRAATLLNSIFRMHLCRRAYIPYRDAFRRELGDRQKLLNLHGEMSLHGLPGGHYNKETKEQDYIDYCKDEEAAFRFHSAMQEFDGRPLFSSSGGYSLVDIWMASNIRDAIHNPVPRHMWGKGDPSNGNFKWALLDGVWVKNCL